MKKLLFLTIITMILSYIMLDIKIFEDKKVGFCSTLESSEIVMEQSTKRILFEKNSLIKRPMASTTKILTCLTCIENCNLNEEVEIDDNSINVEGSSIYLKKGEKLKVIDLLYGLMLRSGNDSAMALAKHVGGSVDNFAKLMNKTAIKLGATNSNFVNPHGLNDKNHYTTARDLAVITCHALNNETFKNIVKTKKYVCVNNFGEKRIFINKNKMLSNYDGADGVKTGFTKNAGRCLVSSATKNGMQLISVVLGCNNMFERSTELLNDCFLNYSNHKIINKNQPIGEINVCSKLNNLNYSLEICCKNDVIIPIKKEEGKSVRWEFDIPKYLYFPVNSNQIVGNLNVYIENKLLKSEKLYIIGEKNKYNFNEAFLGIVKSWGIYEN